MISVPFQLQLHMAVLKLRSALLPILPSENDVMWPLLKVMTHLDRDEADGFFQRDEIDWLAFGDGRRGFASAMIDAGILIETDGRLWVADWSLWRDATAIGYGPEWGPARKAALRRDGHTCCACGSDENLMVHHKRPILSFEGNTKAGNDLSNLVTLCRRCHRAAHRDLRAEAK